MTEPEIHAQQHVHVAGDLVVHDKDSWTPETSIGNDQGVKAIQPVCRFVTQHVIKRYLEPLFENTLVDPCGKRGLSSDVRANGAGVYQCAEGAAVEFDRNDEQ